jgi:NADPH:quinone reductase-like Zn-dependent oxidoreductase
LLRGDEATTWLTGHGAVPVNYGDDLPARLLAAAKSGHIDALLDFFGGGYVAMAIEDLRLSPEKVDTIADFDAVNRFGVQSKGGADAATASVVAELADLVARGELEVPIAGVFALDDVREAHRQIELRHTRGKLVLRPWVAGAPLKSMRWFDRVGLVGSRPVERVFQPTTQPTMRSEAPR